MTSSTKGSLRNVDLDAISLDWDLIERERKRFDDAERRKQMLKEAAYRKAAREGGFGLVRRLMQRYGRVDR